jgi:hypothetical protein
MLGYVCQKATVQLDSATNLVAWFTPQIPVSTGPGVNAGLPGLILEMAMNGDQRTVVATQVDLKKLPKGSLAKGETLATQRGTRTAGMNRVWWNLRTDPTKEIRLRTSPAYAPDIRLNAEGWRPLPEGGRVTILVPPGSYTIKLTVDGKEYSQPLTILKDPNSAGSEADISRQMTILWDLRKDMESVADMVNQIETVRGQLDSLRTLVKDASVKAAADDLEKKLTDIEDNLIQRRLTGQGQDTVRWPPKLISKLNYLANGVGGSDFAPTTQHQEVTSVKSQV